jgi:hypothetical protein
MSTEKEKANMGTIKFYHYFLAFIGANLITDEIITLVMESKTSGTHVTSFSWMDIFGVCLGAILLWFSWVKPKNVLYWIVIVAGIATSIFGI